MRLVKRGEPPIIEHGEHIRHGKRLLEPVLGQDNGHAELIVELSQRREKIRRGNGVKLARRLVQYEHVRMHNGSRGEI